MKAQITRWLTAGLLAVAASTMFLPDAQAACGCDKPPPPRASVRPFVGHADQQINLFDDRLVQNARYTVLFESRDGRQDWSRGKAAMKRDFADGQYRMQLRVEVGDVSMGPVAISVYDDANKLVYGLGDDQFTVIANPIVLHDFKEGMTQDDYQTGIGADGTMYVAIDTTNVTDATTYTGSCVGFPLRFDGRNVAFFNDQGFLMGFLDPKVPGLFAIGVGDAADEESSQLKYWRHEFRTYKEEHRKRDERRSPDGEWHVDGTPHVDNYHMVVAISGTMPDGQKPTPGTTPPFQLVVTSDPSAVPNAR
jgi:hypothetical protein